MTKILVLVLLLNVCFKFDNLVLGNEFIESAAYAGKELDIDKNEKLFQKMFGEEYNQVLATASKADDEKFALDLLTSSESIKSNIELQTYLKFKAAEMLISSEKNKKRARDLLIETKTSLPHFIMKEVDLKVFELQKGILNTTPATNKALFTDEIIFYISFAQILANSNLQDYNFSNAINILNETQRYTKFVEKEVASEINKKISTIQKDATRFNQIQLLLKKLESDPKDEKINLQVAEYYLFERNNLFKAWPYLNNVNDEIYSHFFHNIKKCITDEQKVTSDGISLSLLSLIIHQPEYLLTFLNNKDLIDPEEIIKKQTSLLENKKNLQPEKIRNVIHATVEKNGENQDVPYQIYLSLASHFDSIALSLTNQQNKSYPPENLKLFRDRLTINKYIALMKANIKSSKTTVDEVDKLKMEVELGKVKVNLKNSKIEEPQVTISTPFLFQQIDDFVYSNLSAPVEGIYTFDNNSWLQFNKDFEIFLDGAPFDSKDKKGLLAQNGALIFNEYRKYLLKSKNRNWGQNIEISFDLLRDYDPNTQGLEFYFLFKPDEFRYSQMFGVYYRFHFLGGNFGVLKAGENLGGFYGSKLQRKLNIGGDIYPFWKADKIKISAIIKNKNFEITIDDESIISFPLTDISQEKNFPNSPIQIFFARHNVAPNPNPVKIDNLYIGPPRNIKKK